MLAAAYVYSSVFSSYMSMSTSTRRTKMFVLPLYVLVLMLVFWTAILPLCSFLFVRMS